MAASAGWREAAMCEGNQSRTAAADEEEGGGEDEDAVASVAFEGNCC